MDHTLLRREAKASLAGAWLMIVLGTLVYLVINVAASYLMIAALIISGPMMYGYIKFITNKVDGGEADINLLFSGFSPRFVDLMVAGILYSIIILIGTIFLIVPGIIAALGLSQTFFILAHDPKCSGTDAIKRSWEMMKGHKSDYFVFLLGFIGWLLLVIITCGLAALYVEPYMTAAQLNYYRMLDGTPYDDGKSLPPTYRG